MTERLVKEDYEFAQLLDLNCEVCMREDDNGLQLITLDQRASTNPDETSVVIRLKAQCQRCLVSGEKSIKSIEALTSCLWR